jgi:fatty-acyl-CoA synthase
VDAAALAGGTWQPSPGGAELVGLGPPLPGTDIQIAAEPGRPGEILLRSASMLDGYLGEQMGAGAAGWLATGDIGYLDQELYVLGRRDDMIVVRGINLYATSMETVLREALSGDARSPTVVPWNAGYAVVAELGPTVSGAGRNIGHAVRATLAGSFGIAPSRVVVVPPGTLPRTPSGKIQRSAVRQRLAGGQLPVAAHWEFDESR